MQLAYRDSKMKNSGAYFQIFNLNFLGQMDLWISKVKHYMTRAIYFANHIIWSLMPSIELSHDSQVDICENIEEL